MNTIIFVPGSPALVTELAPHDEPGQALVAAARQELADAIANGATTIDIVGSQDPRWRTAHTGSLWAWGGVETQVSGGNYLAEIVVRYIADDIVDSAAHVNYGHSRTTIGTPAGTANPADGATVTLVAIDGSAGLTARAPLALLDEAADMDAWCRDLLSGGDPEGVDRQHMLNAGIIEPQLWQEAWELQRASTLASARLVCADTSLGVGRYVATWEVN